MNEKTLKLSTLNDKVKAFRAEAHAAKVKADKAAKLARQRDIPNRNQEIIKILCLAFPQCFSLKNRKPLKVGIKKDIRQALGSRYNAKELNGALGYYIRHLSYQQALANGDSRYDLSGAVAGMVAEKEAEFARAAVKRIEARRKEPHQGQRQRRHG